MDRSVPALLHDEPSVCAKCALQVRRPASDGRAGGEADPEGRGNNNVVSAALLEHPVAPPATEGDQGFCVQLPAVSRSHGEWHLLFRVKVRQARVHNGQAVAH